jgi:hypothetical protein
MGLTATTVEIPGGEMGDLGAEHLEEDRGRRHRKFHRQTDHATIEMDSSQRAPKPSAPLDSDALLKTSELPAVPKVSAQTLDAQLTTSAAGRRYAGLPAPVWRLRSTLSRCRERLGVSR